MAYWDLLHNIPTMEVYATCTARIAMSDRDRDRTSASQLCSLFKRMDSKGMTMVLRDPERRQLREAGTERGGEDERTRTGSGTVSKPRGEEDEGASQHSPPWHQWRGTRTDENGGRCAT